MSYAIETRGLTKRYGKARGIENLSMTVETGDIFGFIGPNGAGKSTTIRTLLGLITATEGEATVLGLSVKDQGEQIRARVGYMPGEAQFDLGLRVKEVIRLSARLRGKDCTQRTNALCEQFELETGRKISDLSLGNRKKVSIVCALQHEPELLLLDEPTSGLDPLMQKAFWDTLSRENARGVTIFLSSHVLSEVQHRCHNAAIIREGQLVVADSVENLARTAARRVTLRGTADAPDIPGVRKPERTDGSVTFLYQGDINLLTQALAGMRLADATIEEMELEEIFLHFYEKGDGQA